MPIHTVRLTLRLFVEDDFKLLRELDGDSAVLRYRSRKHIDEEMTREFLQRAQRSVHEKPRRFYAYAVLRRQDGEWLGQCGLTVPPAGETQPLAWYSLLPRHWGQGYMSEAFPALLYAGGTHFKLPRLCAECDPQNKASRRVLEKAGMELDGRVPSRRAAGERLRYVFPDGALASPGTGKVLIEAPL